MCFFFFFKVWDYSTWLLQRVCLEVFFITYLRDGAVLPFQVNKLVAFRDSVFFFRWIVHLYTCISTSHYFRQESASFRQCGLVAQASCCDARFDYWGLGMPSTYELLRETLAHKMWFRPVGLNAHPRTTLASERVTASRVMLLHLLLSH